MNLTEKFNRFIRSENLFQQKDRLLIAVSGGVDSVVLCDLCKRAGYHFSLAHCNFQLRGKESDDDEIFVKELAARYEADFFVKKFDTPAFASVNKLSIQVAARELRYSWFMELLDQQPADYLLTAHHADDNIETVLMNFFKGSGINGLKGILPKKGKTIRPLLFAGKDELIAYAEANKLLFREDSSNSSDKYTRNYFRNELIPGLEKVFPHVKENLADNIERFRDIQALYHEAITKIISRLVTIKGTERYIPVLKLLKTTSFHTVLFEIIKDLGFTAQQLPEVVRLLHTGSGKYIDSSTHRILHNRSWLIISPLNDLSATQYVIEPADKEVVFPGGKIRISQTSETKIVTDNNIAMLDASRLKYPMLLRRWKQGDYFYPLGMQKKKKLARFFIDQKFSLNQKQDTWIIEMNKKIIWVVGHRIDDRFKITGQTKEVLKLSFVEK